MIYTIECVTRLETSDAVSRVRDTISRAGGRLSEHRLIDHMTASFHFRLPDTAFESFLDMLPEIVVFPERTESPHRVHEREVRCHLLVSFLADGG